MDTTQQRRQAHSLLDALPDEKIAALRGLLEVMVEVMVEAAPAAEPAPHSWSRSLAISPVEDEDLTPETAVALDRARASLARGDGVSHQEVLREFGL
jgi:hypothetical protein